MHHVSQALRTLQSLLVYKRSEYASGMSRPIGKGPVFRTPLGLKTQFSDVLDAAPETNHEQQSLSVSFWNSAAVLRQYRRLTHSPYATGTGGASSPQRPKRQDLTPLGKTVVQDFTPLGNLCSNRGAAMACLNKARTNKTP